MLSSRENRIQRENKIRIDFIFLNMNSGEMLSARQKRFRKPKYQSQAGVLN